MTFFKRINTILNTKITPFINNGIFRYYHNHSLHDDYLKIIPKTNIPKINIPKTKIIINLLGELESVDTASWEIKSIASEKSLYTANIVYDYDILQYVFLKKQNLQFIVNRCYKISCEQLLFLNQDIMYSETNWKSYNLYVMPYATNRFTKCDFVENCNCVNIIIYPLAASHENKKNDINKLIKDIEK